MKIENDTGIDFSSFSCTPVGSIFIYNDNTYLKLKLGAANPAWYDAARDCSAAVNLEENYLEFFAPETRIIIVNATLTLED